MASEVKGGAGAWERGAVGPRYPNTPGNHPSPLSASAPGVGLGFLLLGLQDPTGTL